MKAEDRRKEIASYLMSEQKPVSGSMLAERFKVSRQIIVQDITALKGAGYDIVSTHLGYLIQKSPLVERVIKIFHTPDKTEDEFLSIVELGGTIVDEFVWHKVYGKIDVQLNIFSQYKIKQFIDGVRSGKSTELMNITGGYHYHTIRAESNEVLDLIEKQLKEKGFSILEDE